MFFFLKFRFVVFLLVCGMVMVGSVVSIGLAGPKLSPIIYQKGETIVHHFVIMGTSKPVEVSAGGDEIINEFFSVRNVEPTGFDMVIQWPNRFVQPGEYTLSLSASEVPDSSGQFSAYASVNKRFRVVVYADEKYLKADLHAPNVNVGKHVDFEFNLQSQGYQDIDSVQGSVTVLDDTNKTLGEVLTKKEPLAALESNTLKTIFNTTGLAADIYTAKWKVNYDGEYLSGSKNFKIGDLNLIILGYTEALAQGFGRFAIQVENNWGNRIENVYAKLLVNGTELLHTPSIDLEPWQKGELSGLVEVKLKPGEYSGLLLIFFDGQENEERIKLYVNDTVGEDTTRTEPGEIQKPQAIDTNIFLSGILPGIMVAFLVALLIFYMRRRNSNGL